MSICWLVRRSVIIYIKSIIISEHSSTNPRSTTNNCIWFQHCLTYYCSGIDFSVCLWDIYTGSLIHRFSSHGGEVRRNALRYNQIINSREGSVDHVMLTINYLTISVLLQKSFIFYGFFLIHSLGNFFFRKKAIVKVVFIK